MRTSLAIHLRCLAAAWLALAAAGALRADGALDPGFGSAGLVRVNGIFPVSGLKLPVPNAGLVIQPDSKIVVLLDDDPASGFDYRLARFLPNGTLDPTFGTGGVVSGPYLAGAAVKTPESLAIAPDGKLIVAGRVGVVDQDEALVMRFLPSGALDVTFGDQGIVRYRPSVITHARLMAAAALPDGSVAACGSAFSATIPGHAGLLARVRPNGEVEQTFPPLLPDLETLVCAIAGGGWVLSGTDLGGGRDLVVRFAADGHRDRNFANDGAPGTTHGADATFYAVTAKPDGGVLQTFSDRGQTDRSAIQSFTARGEPDPHFGAGGLLRLGQSSPRERNAIQLRALGVLPDGRVLAAGSLNGDLAVTRLLRGGGLDLEFGDASEPGWVPVASQPGFVATDLALGPDGAVAVLGKGGSSLRDLLLARLVETACHPDAFTACLLGDRYQVTATFRTGQGVRGHAKPVELTPDSAVLWFFAPSNLEVTVKVLDGCTLNKRIWIFASGLTNVEVDLRVRDSVTGQVRTYHSPPNTTFAPVLDTTGFACP